MLAVEEKLNELLDVDGGISKRKVSSYPISNSVLLIVLFGFRRLKGYVHLL